MRYVVLLFQDESTRTMPGEAAWEAEMAGYMAFAEMASEAIVDANPLVPFGTRTIRHDGDNVLVTDGPFAETTEVLGGYYVLDVDNLDDLIELVRHIPATAKGGAELRPVAFQTPLGPPTPTPEGAVRWMVNIVGPESGVPAAGTPESEAMGAAHAQFAEKAGDARVGGFALHPAAAATTVKVRDGELLVTDGPYAETTEVIGGYYLLRATPEDIIDLAADVPVADGAGVVVQQILDVPG